MYFSKSQILAILAFTSAVAATPLAAPRVSHKGTRVLRLDVRSEEDVALVEGLVKRLQLDTWTHGFVANSHVDVAVPASVQPEFNRVLKNARLVTRVMHEDLEASIEAESQPSTLMKRTSPGCPVKSAVDPSWFTAYHAYDNHLKFLQALVAAYPGNAEIVTAGKSTEGRDLTGIHIWGTTKGRPAVVLHANVHAREWITSKVVEYFANELLKSTTSSSSATVNAYDYFIFPVVNPDGFVYSQTSDRMWRKNRLRPSGSSSCYGTDINRNWDFNWNLSGGASTNQCAQDFKGVSPGNTAEYKGLSAFIVNLKKTVDVKLFIDYHSYSQLILSPWGYTCKEPAPDEKEHLRVMKIWEAAMSKSYGTRFQTGPSCTTIYPTTGDSTDWTYGAVNITHSYSVELRDTGRNGFVLPPAQIIPSGKEAWEGFQALIEAI
ncbi:hypothetical protein DRE_03432 [Drechslerella stenobrocha 248]|uniref:Carboxypeptidase M14A n=1 Tax=Drechslerella stenobrocha 248 TaxID=1043628 RepID=W7I555_9PEZI|nr:hypothetical protein DRE_03432 [Drechslerella stenobrocha 248]